MDAFYEGVASDDDSGVEEERVLVDKQVFSQTLFTLESAFVYSCRGMSMWLFIRSSPISFIYNTHSKNIYSIFNSMNCIVKKKKKSILNRLLYESMSLIL